MIFSGVSPWLMKIKLLSIAALCSMLALCACAPKTPLAPPGTGGVDVAIAPAYVLIPETNWICTNCYATNLAAIDTSRRFISEMTNSTNPLKRLYGYHVLTDLANMEHGL